MFCPFSCVFRNPLVVDLKKCLFCFYCKVFFFLPCEPIPPSVCPGVNFYLTSVHFFLDFYVTVRRKAYSCRTKWLPGRSERNDSLKNPTL